MKKLLVLSLVLTMASLAGAGLRLGNVDGVILRDKQVFLMPSDILELTIVATENQLANIGAVLGVVIADPISGSVAVGANAFNNVNPALGEEGIFDLDSETAGAFGMSTAVFVDMIIPASEYPPMGDGIVAGGILFHCDDLGGMIVQIVDLDRGIVMDELIIHSFVPEPASMLLLGLGGLFLRRRK